MSEPELHRFIKQSDVPKYVGMQRTRIAEMVAAGEFPKPVFLGNGRGKVWLESEIRDWQMKLLAKRAKSKG